MVNYDYYIVDTNVLMRYLTQDNKEQYDRVAPYFLSDTYKLVIPNHVLCEMVWIMCKGLKLSKAKVAKVILSLVSKENIIVDNDAVDIAIKFMDYNGDFADGVIAYQVSQYADASLLTFDKKAQKIAHTLGIAVTEPK